MTPRHKGDRSQSRDERKNAGRVQLALWVSTATKEALVSLAGKLGVTQSEALAFAIETADRRAKKGDVKKDDEGGLTV